MRRLPALLLTIAAAAAVAACSAGSAPGWTYAPAASGTPVPSGAESDGPSGQPSGGASGAPSMAPSVAPSATAGDSATPSGGGVAITIKAPLGATTTGFDPTTAEAAAGTAFSLTFDNEDNQAPHNLVIFNPDGTTKVAVQGDTAFFTGPAKRDYLVPALTAGAYPFKCEIHPTTMLGTITVK